MQVRLIGHNFFSMNSLSDKELIKNSTLFHAYFCHLIESDQADSIEELCEISWQLNQEINRRKISEVQIEDCIKNAKLDPQDQLMVSTYIYPDSSFLISKISNS